MSDREVARWPLAFIALPAAVAIWVTSMAMPAVPLAAMAEPALKPNQPNHSMAAPIRV